jgi:1,2-phenylacetyl-CoA epoxidase catalytic subunit
VFTPLAGEPALVEAGILDATFDSLAGRWLDSLRERFNALGLPLPAGVGSPAPDGRAGHEGSESFRWLWGEFTSVYRSQPGASW